jgi:hypothetical protein
MDDLDRMFRRLVQNIRNGYPEYLSQPFEVAELYQSLVPYRHNRRELEIDSNEEYEVVLCRLLAGERALLSGDDVMKETIREELTNPNPNTTIYREFASSRVVLVPDALRRADVSERALDGPPSPAPRGSPTLAPSRPPTPAPSWPAASAAPGSPRVSPAIGPLPPRPHASPPAPPPAPRASGARRADPLPSPPPRPSGRATGTGPTADISSPAGQCRFCGGALPAGRRVVFCPNCGQNLAIQRCPACGSELEISWKFCVTCGRGAGGT